MNSKVARYKAAETVSDKISWQMLPATRSFGGSKIGNLPIKMGTFISTHLHIKIEGNMNMFSTR